MTGFGTYEQDDNGDLTMTFVSEEGIETLEMRSAGPGAADHWSLRVGEIIYGPASQAAVAQVAAQLPDELDFAFGVDAYVAEGSQHLRRAELTEVIRRYQLGAPEGL